MTTAQQKRIKELESALALLLQGAVSDEEKFKCIDEAYSALPLFCFPDPNDPLSEYRRLHSNEIMDLYSLYKQAAYVPDEDEKALSYLLRDGMTTEGKLKALANAWWYATNSGYSDAMANRLMAGLEDAQTQLWEQHCENKYAIDRYYNWLKSQSEN